MFGSIMRSQEQLTKIRIGNGDCSPVSGEKSSADMELCESFAQNLTLKNSNINDHQNMDQQLLKTGDSLNFRWNEVRNMNTPNHSCDFYFKQDSQGDTPLHVMIIRKYLEASLWLITIAPKSNFLDIVNDHGQTPLHLAVLTGQSRVVRMLILAGVNTEIRLQSGNTALHLACSLGDVECVRALIEPISEGEKDWLAKNLTFSTISEITVDLELRNYVGQTCLHLAAAKGNIEIVRYLLNFGANVEAREGLAGKTALHLAVENNCREVVHFLVQEHRSCLDVVSYSGKTAYQLAVDYKSQVANDLLLLETKPDLQRIEVDSNIRISPDDDADNYIPLCVKAWEKDAALVSF